ncbi:MAG: hypothetical protein JO265_05985 [Acidimicrobiia bacterium]|nr:hypothetical protein [Acidimicrobiia bacterium]
MDDRGDREVTITATFESVATVLATFAARLGVEHLVRLPPRRPPRRRLLAHRDAA